VHINRLKKAFNPELWNTKQRQKPERNAPRRLAKPQYANGIPQGDFKIGPYSLVCPQTSEARTEHEPLVDHSPDSPDLTQQPIDTPISERNDPSYQPPNTPFSWRELQTSRTHSLACVRRICLKTLKTCNICVLLCVLQGDLHLSREQSYMSSHLITVSHL